MFLLMYTNWMKTRDNMDPLKVEVAFLTAIAGASDLSKDYLIFEKIID